MDNRFFEKPVINSPYEYPKRHWELDSQGQPTQQIIPRRRRAEFITPIPKPRKRKGAAEQRQFVFNEGKGLSTEKQQYDPTSIINQIRQHVDQWRSWPNPNDWKVTPETARLLQHWRHYKFNNLRPFFCQVEAAETAIWLIEVAPQAGKSEKFFVEHLANANHDANPELMRFALKLATGAGKTTVMAMLIAWQTINAVRRPNSKKFTRGFLVVTPGLTIKDRLRVLQSNDPDSYYASRELVPADMLDDVNRAKIVITNYHAFKPRERIDLSKGGRSLLQGRGEALNTLETEGQTIQRVMPDLMGMKNILVFNDEAHHCYREKPGAAEQEDDLKGDEKKEAKKNTEAARLWISGLEAVNRKLGVARVIDLSATPFFLSGSGYVEGTLFPWTVSDFSLMDAIECGIVKLPRVPVADNIPGEEMPMFRNLWEHIRSKMPRKGRGKSAALDPLSLPPQLQTALEALYGHYEKTFDLWDKAGIRVPPCFIVVCQNTAISKLVYDFISGFLRNNDDGSKTPIAGRLALFRNFDEHGNPFARPNTLLIDSEQLESGEALDDNFRGMAADEIEGFRREIFERGGKLADQLQKGKVLDDVTLLSEERLTAEFNEDSVLELTPDLVGATETQNSGIIGEKVDLNLVHTGDVRPSQVLYELVSHLVLTKWRDPGEDPKLHLFGQLKRIARQWIDGYLVCKGGTYPAQLKYKMLADMACAHITDGITRAFVGQRPIMAVLDPYNPTGSTIHVNFNTSKTDRWETDARRCHINWVILDSDWEGEFCRVAESHPRVRAYVKNHNLGLEVPYRFGSEIAKISARFHRDGG